MRSTEIQSRHAIKIPKRHEMSEKQARENRYDYVVKNIFMITSKRNLIKEACLAENALSSPRFVFCIPGTERSSILLREPVNPFKII